MAQQPKRAQKSANDDQKPVEGQRAVEETRTRETRPLPSVKQQVNDEPAAHASTEAPAEAPTDDATLLHPSVRTKNPTGARQDAGQDAGVAPASAPSSLARSAGEPIDEVAD